MVLKLEGSIQDKGPIKPTKAPGEAKKNGVPAIAMHPVKKV